MNNKKEILLDFLGEFYYPLMELDNRIHKENPIERSRNNYQRDYSRILYSTSFRRLQGKMQLLGVQSDKFYRNRLTHSLEVAQIARGIAENLRSLSGRNDVYVNDIYVVEAGALAHDIGNPPFGHHGERVLNTLMEDKGGFEGNAQTIRVLSELEKKLPNKKGLNLTLRTLLSVVKYYVPYQQNENPKPKKFIYESSYNLIKDSLERKSVSPRTIDVQIVDLADEIAYAAHDLEDALSLKLFNIDEFLFEFKHSAKISDYDILEDLVTKAKTFARSASNYNSSEEFGLLLRKELTSNLVNKLINDIGIVNVSNDFSLKTGTKNNTELGFESLGSFANGLKQFTFSCINRSNIVQIYEKKGEKIIKSLFKAFNDEAFNKGDLLLPVEFRSVEIDKERAIADYISGMMDSYAFSVYKELYGTDSNKLYDDNYFSNYTSS